MRQRWIVISLNSWFPRLELGLLLQKHGCDACHRLGIPDIGGCFVYEYSRNVSDFQPLKLSVQLLAHAIAASFAVNFRAT